MQIMTFEEAKSFKFNPFDLTKVWSHQQFPLIEVGNLVLDRNPENYFAEIEQLAFSPANMVSGIEPSPDRMLQGRLFSYTDTQRHRLGANFCQIPVNKPRCPVMHVSIRNGPFCVNGNMGSSPNYWPNSFSNARTNPSCKEHCDTLSGDVERFDNQNEDNFEQGTDFWNNVLSAEEKDRLAANIAGNLKNAEQFIQEMAVQNFEKVHPDLGTKLRVSLNLHKVSCLD